MIKAPKEGGRRIVVRLLRFCETTFINTIVDIIVDKFVDFINRQIATVWRGGDLSTNSRGGSGSTGALPQLNQEEELAEADCILLSEALNFYFDTPCMRYLFGAPRPLAKFRIVPPENIDTATEIALMEFLLSVGVPVSVAYMRDKFGVPEPGPTDALAQAPQPQAEAGIGKGIGDGPATGPLSLGNAHFQAAAFRRIALKNISTAQARALEPVSRRLREIQAIENDEQRQAAIASFKKDLPNISKSVFGQSSELVRQFEAIIGTSLVSGAVESSALH